MKKIYLAGPMRGIPEFNFPAFYRYADMLRKEGHFVFSPAEKDNEKAGKDISSGNINGDEAVAEAQHGFSIRTALFMDMEFICLHADMIAMMPGWERSSGARAEHATAIALGDKIQIRYLT